MTEISQNPLIKECPQTTIQATRDYVRWMVSSKSQDAEADPGELLSWQVVLAALDSAAENK